MPTTLLKSRSSSSPVNPSGQESASGLLRNLCRQPELHARFLNTLSLLEHIGSRKILLSLRGSPWQEDSLRHLAEETRHAYFFRRAAEKVAHRTLDYGEANTLAPWSARMYFGRLDASVTRELGADERLAYRYVTLAVELRAQWFYGLYEDILQSEGVTLTLKNVLAEEDGHLREMDDTLKRSDPSYASRRQNFVTLETALFDQWLAAVQQAAF